MSHFNYENILQEAKARLAEARSHPTKWSADNRENTLEYWCAWAAHANAEATATVCQSEPYDCRNDPTKNFGNGY